MSKWKRTLLALGIVVVFIGVYCWFFGFQTMSALLLRYEYRKLPDVDKTPLPLADLSISSVPHKKVTYFGYEFELPWDDVDEPKDKTTGQIRVGAFRSGNAFWFSTFPPKSFVDEFMKTSKLNPRDFRQLYGDAAFESDYGFNNIMLQMTPSQITPFVSRRQAAVGALLLLFKGISMPKADSGIFSIQTPDFQGFQFQGPQNRPFKITDELYSNDGGVDVMFLQKVGGSAPSISKAEINRVIQSIHKVPVQTVASNTGEPERQNRPVRFGKPGITRR
jgi:hypothetical protein